MTSRIWSLLAVLLLLNISVAFVADDYPDNTEVHKITALGTQYTAQQWNKTLTNSKIHGVKQLFLNPTGESIHIEAIIIPSAEIGPANSTVFKVAEFEFRKFIGTADAVFQVSKKWLTDKSLVSGDVGVYLLNEYGKWEKQESEKTSDKDYVYYRVSGISDDGGVFATSSEPAKVEAPVVTPATPTGQATEGFDLTGWIIGAVIFLVLVGMASLGYVLYNKQQFRSAI